MADPVDAPISDVIRNGLHQVLTKELDSEKIDYSIEAGSKIGDNFTGIVYRVHSKLTVVDSKRGVNKNKSSFNVILKVAPKRKARRDMFSSRICFLREIHVYDEVLPLFRQFQESKRIIPEENGFHEYPKCYKTIDADMDETLILQDLQTAQFEMFDRLQLLTIDHVLLIMKTLGKYHALSFALRDQQPEKLKQYSGLEEIFSRTIDDSLKAYYNLLVDGMLKSLDQNGDDRLLEKVNELFKRDLMTLLRECVNGEAAEPYAIICHGDCWNNNILFKHDGETKKPIDLRLLDWQVARYASPVTDLVHCIFCCTTKPLRDQYYDDLINAYHESLTAMLTRLGSDPVKLFPFDALQDQLRQFGKFGLVTTTLLLPMITTEAGTIDVDDLAVKYQNVPPTEISKMFSNTAVFNKRMRDVIVDMDRLGYI